MTAGLDPATASQVWNSPIYTTGSAKFSSTVSNKVLVEGGFSTNYERYNIIYQPGLTKERGTPEWYTTINRQDTALGTQDTAALYELRTVPGPLRSRSVLVVRDGCPQREGRHPGHLGILSAHADGERRPAGPVHQRPRLPGTILNTPLDFRDQLLADLGVYAQDAWTLNRLTMNLGVRFERFAHQVPANTSGAGRFTAARSFAAIPLPTWNSVSPRFGAVYDLFGDQRTALKFSIGKYMQAGTTGFSETYNPLALTTGTVAWTDLNGDSAPQGELGCVYLTAGCELNLAQLPAGFGVASLSNFDPDIKRMYNIETSVNVQHELLPRVSVSGGWFHRDYKNLRRRDNVLQSFSDYTPFTLFSPIDGAPIAYYNVSTAARSRVSTVDLDRGQRSEAVVQRASSTATTPGCRGASRCLAAARANGRWRSCATSTGTRTCCSTAIRPRADFRSGRSSSSPARFRFK